MLHRASILKPLPLLAHFDKGELRARHSSSIYIFGQDTAVWGELRARHSSSVYLRARYSSFVYTTSERDIAIFVYIFVYTTVGFDNPESP